MLSSGHEVILAMDANLTYDPGTRGIIHPLPFYQGIPTTDKKHDGTLSTLVATCELFDPLAWHHSSRHFPPSHNRGSERIDFVFVSKGISASLVASGCMPRHSLFNSDHHPYYIDIDSKVLFADPA
jgi:endonuclease/exonuclease/phosphatase family metal-dependent hydrolase